MRILGIDYGEKRIGLSFGDELGVATPLPALRFTTIEQVIAELQAIAKQKRLTEVVVGYPYNMDGTTGFKAREVDAFISILEKALSLPMHRIDERLTTHEVTKHLKKGRDDAMRRSGKIDSAAATLILQDFLNQKLASSLADQSEPEDLEP